MSNVVDLATSKDDALAEELFYPGETLFYNIYQNIVEENIYYAFRYFKKAAKLNHHRAMIFLGHIYIQNTFIVFMTLTQKGENTMHEKHLNGYL